jgi:hypothetical protein
VLRGELVELNAGSKKREKETWGCGRALQRMCDVCIQSSTIRERGKERERERDHYKRSTTKRETEYHQKERATQKRLLYNLATEVLGIYLREIKTDTETKISTRMFRAVLFIIVPNWK